MARPARSRRRCGGGEPSPGADAGRVEPHLGANVTGASPAPAAQPSPRRQEALRDGANANGLFVQSLSWIHVGLNFFWCVTHGVVPPLSRSISLIRTVVTIIRTVGMIIRTNIVIIRTVI